MDETSHSPRAATVNVGPDAASVLNKARVNGPSPTPEYAELRTPNDDLLAGTFDRWQRGVCPCCGGTLCPDDTVVAEGVRMCCECIQRGHEADDVLPQLLSALVRRL